MQNETRGPQISPFDGHWPDIHPAAFIAPGCQIIGRVTVGAEASIWFNCVLRGDVNEIRIGARSNVQDGTVIHCDSDYDGSGGYPTIIGEDALVGHMAMLHGCTVADRGFVGLGAIAMNGTTIAADGMLAAGGLLTPGKAIGSGELWAGRPARLLRPLTEGEIVANRANVAHYVRLAAAHRATTA